MGVERERKEQKEEEKERPGDPLEKVEPVSPVPVIPDIRPRLARNYDPVNAVKQQRHEDAEDLQKDQIRHVVDVAHVLVEHGRAVHRGRVRVHVNEKENAERDDPGQLM